MQSNLIRQHIEKIFAEFNKLNKFPKAIIKYGIQAFFALFILGTLLVALNHSALDYDFYLELIATTIVKSSFTILAEVVIGGLLIDFVLKKA